MITILGPTATGKTQLAAELAANIDAVETAGRYGIRSERAVNYRDDSLGTTRVYESINHAVRAVRSGRSLDEEHSWRENADRDFHKRGN